MHAMGVVPSTLHIKVKFSTEDEVVVIRGGPVSIPTMLGNGDKP